MKETILILTHVGFDGSPYCAYVHDHAKAMKEQGYNVIVLANINYFPFITLLKRNRKNFYEKYKGEKEIDGVKIIYTKQLSFSNLLYNTKINLNGISYYLSVKNKIKNIIKRNKVILIDAHTFKVEGYVAYKLKKKYNINTFVTCHGTSIIRNLRTKNGVKQIKKISKKIDYYICVSKNFEKSLNKLNINNTKTIYNGVNNYNILSDKKDSLTIVSVGALIKRKKFDIIIRTIDRLRKTYKNIKLIIIGNGEQKENLIRLVKELNLQKNVELVGQIPNRQVHSLMNKSNLFLLTSVEEGWGIVYAEAMLNRCITIGTKGEGIDGTIINKENGFLVNPDSEEIEKLIIDIYKGKYDLEKIRDASYNTVKDLTWENNAKNYLKILK